MSDRTYKTKVKAKKKRDIFDGKRDPTTQLYRAVKRFVESKGGALVVIGGIKLIEWPEDRAGIFGVEVKCLGRKPSK